jgi:gliding motility-associated-like protein
LQYDDVNNILYAQYFNGNTGASFCSIDPKTSVITVISHLPGGLGTGATAFDQKDHLYFVNSGNSMLVIDALTGVILHSWGNVHVTNIAFDNLTGTLYGIDISNNLQAPEFDSVSVTTGNVYPISILPTLSGLPIAATAIDENAGKYIFVASDNEVPGCVANYLFVVDIQTGAILSKTSYPYAESPGNLNFENLSEYSFDNKRGILYAADWYPPRSPQLVSIAASPAQPCAGSLVTFTATAVAGLSNIVYQWQVNGQNAGANSPTFAVSSLKAGDSVVCMLMHNSTCAVTSPVVSNTIVIAGDATSTSLSINTSSTTTCSGDTVFFVATPVNGGIDPSYEWMINGMNTGIHADSLISASLSDGDIVNCIMTSSVACATTVSSINSITMAVSQTPSVNFVSDTIIIKPGQTVVLSPVVSKPTITFQWSPATYLDNANVMNPVAGPSGTITYKLTVTTIQGCSASAKETIIPYASLEMPNAFTPNGDGRNDVFRIPPSITETIDFFTVYNRLGGCVFTTNNSSAGWDGTFNNKKQPAGNYVWMIRYTDLISRKKIVVKGTVMLVR